MSANAIKQYTEKFEEHATESHEQTKERIQKDEVLNFDEYLNKVKEHFGEISKEFLISSLYHLSGFRDDLILKIVDKQPKETDENFLIMPPKATANCSILLNNYKTADKYGQQKISIDRVLSKIIREYINNKGLIYNNYLFGNKKLSSFIKKFNDKMGLKVSINNLRQMRVSEILNNNPSILDRVKLSHEMNHKATTSEKYQRKIK